MIIPIDSIAMPSTLANALAPNLPLVTALPTTGPTSTTGTSTTTTTSTQKTKELMKFMEEMKIQATEIQKLKEKVTSLEHNYEISQINYTKEERRNRRMTDRIKTSEKDLTFENPLRDMREILWTNIINSINDIWSSIQIISE